MQKKLQAFVEPYQLNFSFNAKTSRGEIKKRDILLLEISDNFGRTGVGEIAPLEGLSKELDLDFEEKVNEVVENIEYFLNNLDLLIDYPSIVFGIESAWMNYKNSQGMFYKTNFTSNSVGIPINALVWMDDFEGMKAQIDKILAENPKCIKLKIGGIDWESELELIQYIRNKTIDNSLDIRLDANGAFSYDEAILKLNQLLPFNIHSIEQPLAKNNNKYELLCDQNIIPIALDEELIGVNSYKDKYKLLKDIQPQFIVLKPSLHGGLRGCEEWIFLARQLQIGWWVTSALESNLGLSAIAQWCSQYPECYQFPQGLGTGNLYSNNLPAKHIIKNYELYFTNIQ